MKSCPVCGNLSNSDAVVCKVCKKDLSNVEDFNPEFGREKPEETENQLDKEIYKKIYPHSESKIDEAKAVDFKFKEENKKIKRPVLTFDFFIIFASFIYISSFFAVKNIDFSDLFGEKFNIYNFSFVILGIVLLTTSLLNKFKKIFTIIQLSALITVVVLNVIFNNYYDFSIDLNSAFHRILITEGIIQTISFYGMFIFLIFSLFFRPKSIFLLVSMAFTLVFYFYQTNFDMELNLFYKITKFGIGDKIFFYLPILSIGFMLVFNQKFKYYNVVANICFVMFIYYVLLYPFFKLNYGYLDIYMMGNQINIVFISVYLFFYEIKNLISID